VTTVEQKEEITTIKTLKAKVTIGIYNSEKMGYIFFILL
jgi:hypothetical protein